MKKLFILAITVVQVGGSCKGWPPKCHYEIINPYQDSCEDYFTGYCGVSYYDCKSGNEYKCTHGFSVRKVCE